MLPSEWQLLETFSTHLAAEIAAGVLRADSVPVRVESFGIVPGLEQGSQLMVPVALMHRARWLLAQARVSDAELDALAMGTPPEP
ncbi:hypothetical protein [Nevskia soli]|uniref:hypothetical protein n=1 Tax=Nevskia soli TaxID=418856 RepID=UPI0004A6D524|nr:hypothetical protein [Nevskia soli]